MSVEEKKLHLYHAMTSKKKYDWESNIKLTILSLRILGLWPKTDEYRGLYMIYSVFLACVFSIGHVFFQIVYMYFIGDDLTTLTRIFYIVVLEILGCVKLHQLVVNVKVLKEIFRILNTDMFQPKIPQHFTLIDQNIWFFKIFIKALVTMASVTNVFWAIYPLLDESEERRLPFMAWYPYDTTISPFYEITYIYQVSCCIVLTAVHTGIDALVAALNVFCSCQFDILCNNLKNLHECDRDVPENVLHCIKYYVQILRFASMSNKFLNWILFVQFFVSAITIGITMFHLTLITPMTGEFYSMTFYLAAMVVQIFMFCWFGNEVEVKSSNIPYAIFECEWFNFSKRVRKDLLFFALRAQKSVKFSAVNLFYLSLDTFMKILKTAYSYFALLNQVG